MAGADPCMTLPCLIMLSVRHLHEQCMAVCESVKHARIVYAAKTFQQFPPAPAPASTTLGSVHVSCGQVCNCHRQTAESNSSQTDFQWMGSLNIAQDGCTQAVVQVVNTTNSFQMLVSPCALSEVLHIDMQCVTGVLGVISIDAHGISAAHPQEHHHTVADLAYGCKHTCSTARRFAMPAFLGQLKASEGCHSYAS
jgi:hypothetical protein